MTPRATADLAVRGFDAVPPDVVVAAKAEQVRMSALVSLDDDFTNPPRRIVALDALHDEERAIAWGAAALIDGETLDLVASARAALPLSFPYVSGLLSFREAPAMLAALAAIPGPPPDLLVVDGQGLAHPRFLGIACHIGVLTGLPAIGVGKSRLVGRYDPPGDAKGDFSPLIHKRRWVGVALRTRPGTRPIFVSPGHKVSITSAARLITAFTVKWRLPEPIRFADAVSRMK